MITNSESEAGPGVLKSSIQQTCILQECQRTKAELDPPIGGPTSFPNSSDCVITLFSGALSAFPAIVS